MTKSNKRRTRKVHFLVKFPVAFLFALIWPIVWVVVYADSLDTFGADSVARANEMAFGTIKLLIKKDT
jgi:hypothetical protein